MWIFSILLVTAAVALIQGFIIEPSIVIVRSVQIQGKTSTPMRVAVLADPHVRKTGIQSGLIDRAVEKTMHLSPDLVLIPGDLVAHGWGGEPADRFEISKTLAPLADAKMGAYVVLGNHDNKDDKGNNLSQELMAKGLKVIDNQQITLPDGTSLIGLPDFGTGSQPKKHNFNHDGNVIVIAHDPHSLSLIPANVDLAVFGHTHGGQVRLPFFGAVLELVTEGDGNFPEGFFKRTFNVPNHLVSSGLGTSRHPIRFFCPPTIWIVDILPTLN